MNRIDNKKVTLIIKGNLKSASHLKDDLSAALPNNYTVTGKYTQNKRHAVALSQEAINEGANYIIAAGGDGTVNEVVNGIMTASEDTRKSLFFGVLPLGTGNDFVRTAKINKSITELAKLIQNDAHIRIDVGMCKFTNRKRERVSRYFNNIAEVGIGAKVVEIVGSSKKRLGGTISFLKGTSKAFLGFKKPYVKIRSKNFTCSGRAVTVCFANGRYFGSGLGISPYSVLNDGKLNLVVIGDVSLLHFVTYLAKLRKCKPINIKQIHYSEITSCELSSKMPSPVEIDGENVGFTPIKVGIVPSAINLLTNVESS